jgi:hypothetical protein
MQSMPSSQNIIKFTTKVQRGSRGISILFL